MHANLLYSHNIDVIQQFRVLRQHTVLEQQRVNCSKTFSFAYDATMSLHNIKLALFVAITNVPNNIIFPYKSTSKVKQEWHIAVVLCQSFQDLQSLK